MPTASSPGVSSANSTELSEPTRSSPMMSMHPSGGTRSVVAHPATQLARTIAPTVPGRARGLVPRTPRRRRRGRQPATGWRDARHARKPIHGRFFQGGWGRTAVPCAHATANHATTNQRRDPRCRGRPQGPRVLRSARMGRRLHRRRHRHVPGWADDRLALGALEARRGQRRPTRRRVGWLHARLRRRQQRRGRRSLPSGRGSRRDHHAGTRPEAVRLLGRVRRSRRPHLGSGVDRIAHTAPRRLRRAPS